MASRSTPSDKVGIDPLFAIPEGAEDVFTYTDDYVEIEDEGLEIYQSDFASLEYEDGTDADYLEYVDDGSDDADQVILETPENFVIFAQNLRRAPGGQQVVDVVLMLEDIPGATNYQIEVVKI